MPHTTFSVEAVAEYLHISVPDVEMLIRREEIPFMKQGGRILFMRKEVDSWASLRILGLEERQLHSYHQVSSAKMHDLSEANAIVTEIMRDSFIESALPAKTKRSAISEMTNLADRSGLLIFKDELLESLLERERLCPTALAGGLAILHPPHHDPYMFEDSFVVLGRTDQPIPYGAPDGRTTDLFFLACCQDDRIHLHVLARLCMMCFHTDLLLRLREAEVASEMMTAIADSEQEVIRSL